MRRAHLVRPGFLAAVVFCSAASAAEAQTGGPFQLYALTPCRIFDTRVGEGGALFHGVVRNFQIANRCGVPNGAKAVALNLVVVSPTSEGHLILWAYNTGVPSTSNINYPAGTSALANSAVTALTTNPTYNISAMAGLIGAGHSVHLILDVTGYFQ